MEIRHLRYFLAVAEQLHFTRAAEHLHMSQPPLSKRIAELERELGVPLFVRDSRNVSLTPDGERLMPMAREVLRAFDAIANEPWTDPAGRALRVGFPTDTGQAVLATLQRHLDTIGVPLSWTEASTAEQHRMLLANDLDIGVLRLPVDADGLWLSPPISQTLGVITAPDHPVAAATAVAMSELRGQRLLMFSRNIAPGLYDAMITTCRERGFTPDEITQGMRSSDSLTVQTELASGRAVTFSTQHWAERVGSLAWRPLHDAPLRWRTTIACRAGTQGHPPLFEAHQVLRKALIQHDHWRDHADEHPTTH